MSAKRIIEYILQNRKNVVLYLLLISVAIFSFHYFLFRDYITDDAGITFGSAKTLVDYGRFSIDRFAETVEAYSNAFWMMLLAGAYWANVPIPIAAKVMTFILGIMTLMAAYLINSRYGNRGLGWTNALSPLMLSVMTGFVLWGAAGLENGLYAFLTAGLLYGCLKFDRSANAIPITLFAFLISITRPEGILIAAFAYMGVFAITLVNRRGGYRALLISLFTVGVLYTLFLFGRYHIFASFFPNTYYAKVSGSFATNFDNGIDYTIEFVKRYWPLFALAIVLMFSPLVFRRNIHGGGRDKHRSDTQAAKSYRVVWYCAVIILANLAYVLYVGGSFFGLDRFFTPMLVCCAIALTELFKTANLLPLREPEKQIEKKSMKKQSKKQKKRGYEPAGIRAKAITLGVVGLLLCLFVSQMATHSYAEYKNPWVRMKGIEQRHAVFGNEVGAYLISNGYLPNAKHVPYMVPDIGATSYYAENYTIIDSAMLGSVPFARNRVDEIPWYPPVFFREYVFNTVRPVIIETHGSWSYVSLIGQYEEFTNNYELIKGRGTCQFGGISIPCGYFIRTDIFKSDTDATQHTANETLLLKGYDINALQFSTGGEIQIDTYWQKIIGTAETVNIDKHLLKIYLESPDNQYVLDEHKITGGYYLPSKWDTNYEILDRRAISVGNIPEGNYSLVLGIIYPDKPMVALMSVEVKIISNIQETMAALLEDFDECLDRNDAPSIRAALGKIKGLDVTTYHIYKNTYTANRLSLIENLIDDNQPFEAYEVIYPLAGSDTGDGELNGYLRRAEVQVSRLLEQEGKQLENKGEISKAIAVYEKSMWLDPDNSHLRRHIEAIRQV